MGIVNLNYRSLEVSDEDTKEWLLSHVVDKMMDITWEFQSMIGGIAGIIIRSPITEPSEFTHRYKHIFLNMNDTETYLHFQKLGYDVGKLFHE